jgi:hypothetical protein
MGFQAPIEFDDQARTHWVGEHRPDLAHLAEVFRSIVALDVRALEAGPASAVDAWRAVLPEPLHVVRPLSARAVHVHALRGPVRDLVLKVSPPSSGSGWQRLTSRIERSRAHRAHLWAHRLRAIGIETPRPLGFVETASAPSRHASFLATEYVDAPILVELREHGLGLLGVRPRECALQEKRALIERVASVLRALEARGYVSDTIDASRLLVTARDVVVLDPGSFREARRRERAWLATLARLDAAFAGWSELTRADRLRFLDAFVRHDPGRPARRRALWTALAPSPRRAATTLAAEDAGVLPAATPSAP